MPTSNQELRHHLRNQSLQECYYGTQSRLMSIKVHSIHQVKRVMHQLRKQEALGCNLKPPSYNQHPCRKENDRVLIVEGWHRPYEQRFKPYLICCFQGQSSLHFGYSRTARPVWLEFSPIALKFSPPVLTRFPMGGRWLWTHQGIVPLAIGPPVRLIV